MHTVQAQEGHTRAAPESGASLEEVIVTAQRREESLQSVPVAVSAFSGEDLQKLGASNNEDLNLIVPGLNIQDRGGIVQPMIRGVGSTASVAGLESAVATYVDGAYNPTSWGGQFRFFDVARIEVLRGPQGTLFGRNATGGLINIVTRDPAMDAMHGDLSVAYGRFNSMDLDGYLSGPLTDTLAAGLSAYYSSSDGYITNPNKPGEDVGRSRGRGVRGKLKFAPTERFEATLAADYVYEDDPSGFWTTVIENSSPFINPAGTAPFITTTDTPRVSTANFARQVNSQTSVTLQTKAVFDGFDFYSTTAYRRSRYSAVNDGDSGPFEVVRLTFDNPAENVSEDARLQSNGTGPLQWIFGGFAFHGRDGFTDFDYTVGAPPFTAPAYATALLINKGETTTTAYAAYGQLSYDLTENLTATAGLRYSVEKKELDAVAMGLPTQRADETFHDLSPKATLQYEFTPRTMAYVTYSEAFKSGAYNPLQIADVVNGVPRPEDATLVVDPEEIKAYGVGVKSDVTDSLRANVEAFYYDYDNLQTTVDTGIINILENAARARIKGAELELLQVVPQLLSDSDKLTLSASVAYLDAIYTSYPDAIINNVNGPGLGLSIGADDVSGNRMVRTPKWTENLGINYISSRGWGSLEFSANASFNSGFFSDEGNNSLFKQGSFHKVNASLSWTSPDSHHMISLWGKNITDTTTFRVPLLLGMFGAVEPWNPPRTYGTTYRYSF